MLQVAVIVADDGAPPSTTAEVAVELLIIGEDQLGTELAQVQLVPGGPWTVNVTSPYPSTIGLAGVIDSAFTVTVVEIVARPQVAVTVEVPCDIPVTTRDNRVPFLRLTVPLEAAHVQFGDTMPPSTLIVSFSPTKMDGLAGLIL